MIKIIKHGTPPKEERKFYKFRCLRCGCEFETDENIVCCAPHMNVEWRGVKINTEFAAVCPECDAGAEEVETE